MAFGGLPTVLGSGLPIATGGSTIVSGPATSTDNAIARWDGTGGNLIQNSVLIVADTTGALSGFTTGVGITFHGSGTITGASGALTATTASNGNFAFALHGTGQVVIPVGAVATPSLAIAGTLTDGIFWKSVGNLALVTAQTTNSLSFYEGSATERAFIQTTGGVMNLGTIGATALNLLTQNIARVTVSSSGDVTLPRVSLGTTSTDGLVLSNTTAAAAGAQQISPRLRWRGFGWKTDATAASQSVDFFAENLPVEGAAAPTGLWKLGVSINGGAATYPLTLTSAGLLTIASSLSASGGTITGNIVNAVGGEIQTAGNRVNYNLSAYGVGTPYAFTNTAAAIDFGTTDPAIVLDKVGTYLISGQVNIAYNGATVAAETATIKVRRTNNTAADLSAVVVLDLPVATTLTHTYGIFQIPPFIYTTAATDDAVTLFANVSAALGAGTIDATAIGTSIVAVRLY